MNLSINRLDNIKIECKSYELVSSEKCEDVDINGAIIGVNAEYYVFQKNIMELVRKSDLSYFIGGTMYRALMRKPMMYFIIPTHENEFNYTKDMFDMDYGNKSIFFNNLAQAFSLACWFIKDSCVSCKYNYWLNLICGYYLQGTRDLDVTLGDGTISTVGFDDEEIHDAIDRMYEIYHYLSPEEAKTGKIEVTKSGDTLTWEIEKAIGTEGNSFARALILLQEARRTGRLATKIDRYCAVLECIYAISKNHKNNISQITAAYIGKSASERETIVIDMRDAYGIRSDSSHGDSLKYLCSNTQASLAGLSSRLDDYVRRVFKNVLSNVSLNYKKDDDSKIKVQLHFIKIMHQVY